MRRPALGVLIATLALPLALRADRIDKPLPIIPGQRFEIDLQTGGSITVLGSEGGVAAVSVARQGRDAADVEVVVEPTSRGARLRTLYTGSRHSYSTDLRIEVRVPRRCSVDLHSMGGEVRLRRLEGDFRGTTMGGELELTELTGEVDLQTFGGDVRVKRSKLNGKVSTNGGDVLFDDVEGSVEGHSLGGRVTYRNVRRAARQAAGDGSAGAVVMSSMGGDLKIEDAPDGADLKTMGGNVHVRSAAKYVKALTMGGDIVIERLDGRVDASSMGGDITVVMAGDPASGDRRVRLDSKAGELRLTVPADLAMDVDVKLFYTRNSRRSYRVHSDFPLQTEISKEWDTTYGSPRKLIHATGRQGAGTHRIELTTINGDVYLTRSQR